MKFLGRGERLFALAENPTVTSYLIHDPKQLVGGIAIAVLNHGLRPFLLAPGVPWT